MPGPGKERARLDPGNTGNERMNSMSRWTFLAQFDPLVEEQFLTYVAAQQNRDIPGLDPTFGSMAYGYLKRAQQLGTPIGQ